MALFDSGSPIANVALSNTFNTWRIRTNQIITQAAGLSSNNVFTGTNNTFTNVDATNFNSLSDASLKTNIVTITNATETLKQIEGVEFDWIKNGEKSAGVIADRLNEILPHLVSTNDAGIKSVNYAGLSAYLIEAVKEFSDRLDKLEKGTQ